MKYMECNILDVWSFVNIGLVLLYCSASVLVGLVTVSTREVLKSATLKRDLWIN